MRFHIFVLVRVSVTASPRKLVKSCLLERSKITMIVISVDVCPDVYIAPTTTVRHIRKGLGVHGQLGPLVQPHVVNSAEVESKPALAHHQQREQTLAARHLMRKGGTSY